MDKTIMSFILHTYIINSRLHTLLIFDRGEVSWTGVVSRVLVRLMVLIAS